MPAHGTFALSDDDTWWMPGSLERAIAVLDQHTRVAVVCARVVVGHARRPDAISAVMAASPLPAGPVPLPRLLGFLAGASVVRRDAFLEVGGFCPRLFLGGEEELVAIDLRTHGWDLVYLEEAVVQHFPSACRDDRARRSLLLRNALWTTWLRWPAAAGLRRTGRLLLQAQAQGALLRAIAAAAAGAPWAVRHRSPVRGLLAAELVRLHLDGESKPDARRVHRNRKGPITPNARAAESGNGAPAA